MTQRRIKRRRGEGITISGPATVHVSRGVTLIIDAAREARITRVADRRAKVCTPAAPPRISTAGDTTDS